MSEPPPGLPRLIADLRALGVPPGDVLVHTSMVSIGRPVGGPATLLTALRTVLGAEATIVVPTQTDGNSTTSSRFFRRTRGMTEAERGAYLDQLEGWTPDSPSHGPSAFPEHLRRQPGAVRSGHPQTSFAALGPRAARLMAVHDLDCHLGERSPLAALYDDAGSSTLLLGVGYDVCTTLHLAEYRVPRPRPRRPYRCFTGVGADRVQHDFEALDLDDSDFAELGKALDAEPFTVCGPIGQSTARLLPIRAAVDFAVGWLTEHRTP